MSGVRHRYKSKRANGRSRYQKGYNRHNHEPFGVKRRKERSRQKFVAAPEPVTLMDVWPEG